MDEKTTAALHEVFEAWAWGNGYALKLDVAETAEGLRHTQAAWAGFLACYQHLAPQLKDAERYRMLRSQESPDLNVQYWDGDFWQEDGGEGLDKTVDAALDLQKEKQQ